jgi:hypothetical protein
MSEDKAAILERKREIMKAKFAPIREKLAAKRAIVRAKIKEVMHRKAEAKLIKTGVKKCTKCGETKPYTEFGESETSRDGRQSYCKKCRDRLGDKIRKFNLRFRIKHHISTRVSKQIAARLLPKGYTRDLETYLGYTIPELIRKLNADLAPQGLNLRQAIEQGWHLDHKRPLSSFKVVLMTDEEFRKCWAISNLEMIPAEENLAKGSKYAEIEAEVGEEEETEDSDVADHS